MRRSSRFCIARLAGIALVLGTAPMQSQVYEGRTLVKAELLADTTTIVPNQTFTVGLLLHMVPGWHTYWKFPGDAGIPTELKWKLPSGWKISEIRWPIPLKLTEPGDIQIYGYHDEVLLTQEITVPPTIAASSVKLAADASWLVCEKICIPGSAALELELPVGTNHSAANEQTFGRFRERLPKSWPGGNVARASWSRSGTNLMLTVESADLGSKGSVDFFPLPQENVVIGHPAIDSRSGSRVAFRIPLESPDQKIQAIPGVLVAASAANGEDRTGWSVADAALAGPSSSTTASGGLLAFLLLGFLGGAILNLMPCVLPVISLKIFGFVQQAGQSRGKILRSGLTFAAGVFAWFIGLAVLVIALKSAGRQITWAFQFTNPYFVLTMSVVVLVFALNLFGVFEVVLPQNATRGILGLSAKEGDVGSFFQGVFATVLATSCTAPFLGPALGFAFAQSPLIILSMFLSISAGLAFPYVLLCAQPAWLQFLPKPGPWMEHTKQFMGFLLLGTLVFLLYVLGAERGLDGLIWTCAFLVVVSLACWIKGRFVTPVSTAATRAVAIGAIAVLLLGSGFYCIAGKFRDAKPGITMAAAGDWQPFSAENLQSELDQNHPVFVDFTAAWCLNCKYNENFVLENASVREGFARHGVTKMRADWTNGDPVVTKFLQRFGRVGVPLYVLYPGKSAEPIVFPELLTRNIVLEKLETIARTVASQ